MGTLKHGNLNFQTDYMTTTSLAEKVNCKTKTV